MDSTRDYFILITNEREYYENPCLDLANIRGR